MNCAPLVVTALMPYSISDIVSGFTGPVALNVPNVLVLRHANRPLGDVARVDDLHGIVAVARREHFAALVDAIRPVGESIRAIERTDDQSRDE